MLLAGELVSTSAYAALEIDANFDSGSMGAFSIDDANSTVDFTLRSETEINTGDTYTYWTQFKVRGALDRTVTFRIVNANLVPFLSGTTIDAQLVCSCDGESWGRIPDCSYSGGMYTFSKTFTCDEPWIATSFPFSYGRMSSFVDAVGASAWVAREVLGFSELGRYIDLLTITNPDHPRG